MIAWNEPHFGDREIELVTEVLKSGYVSEGPMTKKLEQELAEVVGCKHIIMTTSCTAALYLAIEADKNIRGYSEGEVITPDLNFVADTNAIEMANLTPKIVDVPLETFCLAHFNTEKQLQIIMPVNLLGRSSMINFELDTCTVICDNAGALGSDVPIGKVGCYSLQGNKIISCGQGGFCATNDNEYAKEIRRLKDFGRENKKENSTKGFNFKFNDILAAVTLGQLEGLEERKKLWVHQYQTYSKSLKNYGKFFKFGLNEVPLWIEFLCEDRDELFEYLKKRYINCRKPWKPIIGLKNSTFYSDNVIWLPNGTTLNKNDLEYTIRIIKQFYENKKNT